MGQNMMRRPPKFVHGFLDRHGRPRFYFRRTGFKKVPLPGLPWSPEFMAAYEEALAGQPAQAGTSRVKPGTIRALAVSYYNSIGFCSLKPITQSVYRNIIDRFCRGDGQGGSKARREARNIVAASACSQADGGTRRQTGQRERTSQSVTRHDEACRGDGYARR